jgi:hypothetical protein
MNRKILNVSVIIFLLVFYNCFGQKSDTSSISKITFSNIKYGSHERNVLDFWQAKSSSPTPLAFVIHGGGWRGGGKDKIYRFADVQKLLDAGISVVAINYRLIQKLPSENETPPVKAPMDDAARALQFVKSKANEWNIDKDKIGLLGESAGACTSLWLAFHNDLKQTDSEDSVERESTRVFCAALVGAQTSLDPLQMKGWIPQITYGGHAFGKEGFDAFLVARDSILPWIKEYSPYELVSSDDPPIYLYYTRAPGTEKISVDYTHSPSFGFELQKCCNKAGVKCDLYYLGVPEVKYETVTDYLIEILQIN